MHNKYKSLITSSKCHVRKVNTVTVFILPVNINYLPILSGKFD